MKMYQSPDHSNGLSIIWLITTWLPVRASDQTFKASHLDENKILPWVSSLHKTQALGEVGQMLNCNETVEGRKDRNMNKSKMRRKKWQPFLFRFIASVNSCKGGEEVLKSCYLNHNPNCERRGVTSVFMPTLMFTESIQVLKI